MKLILLFFLLSSSVVMNAQARPAICDVRPLWVIKGEGGVRSANLGSIGTFQTDGKQGVTIRSFKWPETGLVITAGVNYRFDYSSPKPRPYIVALAVTVSDQNKKDIFESVDSAEARTLYGKKWNLAVTKNIFFDNRIYMFTLRCWDGATQRMPLYW